MNLTVLTAVHGRHEIAAQMVRRLRQIESDCFEEWKINPLVVMSYQDVAGFAPVCESLGVRWCAAHNNPVSYKFQTGLSLIRGLHDVGIQHCDAMMTLGSDDFFCKKYFHAALAMVDPTTPMCVGPDAVYMFNTGRCELGLWQGPMIGSNGEDMPAGAGRIYNRRLLDAVEWKLWPDEANIGLDTMASKRLAQVGYSAKCINMKEIGGVVLDIKSGNNIHPISEFNFANVITDPTQVMELLAKAGYKHH